MTKRLWMTAVEFLLLATGWVALAAAGKIDEKSLVTGPAAFGNAPSLKPGTFHKITLADLPEPFATDSSRNNARMVPRPNNVWPKVPPGFQVDLYAAKVNGPRKILTAPNGDFFVAASGPGEILVFRGRDADGRPQQISTFATGLNRPFGIAFYPAGPNPQWIYIGNTDSVVRFPYKNGDLKAGGSAETVVPKLPTGGGHWTRDLVFSPDGNRLFVAVGSASNINDPDTNPNEQHRANILEYSPDGKFVGVYASGIRNPVGLGVNPSTGELWCSTNERDALGDNLVPDYITHVQRGGFYGWPYFYIGGHPDPRLEGKHAELKDKVIVPDVLMTPHNASLSLTFYDGIQFPQEYRGDLFAAEHGSWNRSTRAGYEVVRVPLDAGRASGVYEDFLTGFVLPNGDVWGRPVGVAVAKDGALMVTDDGSGSIWRISYTSK
jgi:glucose/arabinose dehydrogenase